VAILRRHLVDKVPVSDVCDKVGIHPTLFYCWRKELFEHGTAGTGNGFSGKT
jgi:transposase-like protein